MRTERFNKIFLTGLLFVFSTYFYAGAQNITVSDSAKISLITCSPGPEVYAKFGHTAIRYQEPAIGMDVVFNYGIFDFNVTGFYYKFIKGETDYQLGVYDTRYFLPEYKERNSQVTEQVLNLTKEEKQKLVEALFTNYLPENRIYRYNFIFDNCATRPRDKILEVINDKVDYKNISKLKTFRDWVGDYTGKKSWTMFGIDLVFGMDADKYSSAWNSMFLPEILSKEFGAVQLVSSGGSIRPLVISEEILVNKIPNQSNKSFWYREPLFASFVLLAAGLMLTLYGYRRKKHYKSIDSILLIITGLAGAIIFYLMFFSIHPLVKSNFNLLWCNPLNLFVGIFLWAKKGRVAINFFQLANVMLFLATLIVFVLSIQSINVASIPVICLLLVRSLYWLSIHKFHT